MQHAIKDNEKSVIINTLIPEDQKRAYRPFAPAPQASDQFLALTPYFAP